MTLFDFIRKTQKAEPIPDRARDLLARLVADLKTASWHWNAKPAEIAICQEIMEADPADQVVLLPLIAEEALELLEGKTRWSSAHLVKGLLSQMLRRKLPLKEQDLIRLAELTGTLRSHYYFDSIVPIAPLLGVIEEHIENSGLSAPLCSALKEMLRRVAPYVSVADNRRAASRIETLLGGGIDANPLAPGDLWADAALSDYRGLHGEEKAAWRDLFAFVKQSAANKPSKRWLKEARSLVEQIGNDRFAATMQRWLPLFDPPRNRDFGSKPHGTFHGFFNDANVDSLRGLIFCCALISDPSIATVIGDAAERAFKKVPGVGAMSPKIGNACVLLLSELGTSEATAQLSRLRTRVKVPGATKILERAFAEAAKRAGLSPEDLEELFVPTMGMTEVGVLRQAIGKFTAVAVAGGPIEWVLPNGKHQTSVPAALKKSADLKQLKVTAAELETMLIAQRDRIDAFYLAPRSWSFRDWRERYLDHSLVGVIARRLIWKFEYPDGKTKAGLPAPHRATICDPCGVELPDLSQTTVSLWHPIDSPPDVVLAWRRSLEAQQITQPFKQAHREIYVITEAELQTSTYSNRFAAHILKQHQFAALCLDRRWRYSLQGGFDSHNTPTRELRASNLSAEFWVEGMGEQPETTEAGIYLYLVTDQVRFHDAHGANVALIDVPPIVFSEVMRHVDLFVGVASIGNDPTWHDHGDARYVGYWSNYSFGELSGSASTRRSILEAMVPKLKIADRCSLDDRFLVVRGDLRTYKIHLGSSNILMEPDDQYLCIVPGRGKSAPPDQKLYVPFEGDSMLSVIVSKAFLLAEDRKIKDPTIVLQLRPR